jgi:hypothetical protein
MNSNHGMRKNLTAENTHKPQAEGNFCETHGKTQKPVIEDHS